MHADHAGYRPGHHVGHVPFLLVHVLGDQGDHPIGHAYLPRPAAATEPQVVADVPGHDLVVPGHQPDQVTPGDHADELTGTDDRHHPHPALQHDLGQLRDVRGRRPDHQVRTHHRAHSRRRLRAGCHRPVRVHQGTRVRRYPATQQVDLGDHADQPVVRVGHRERGASVGDQECGGTLRRGPRPHRDLGGAHHLGGAHRCGGLRSPFPRAWSARR